MNTYTGPRSPSNDDEAGILPLHEKEHVAETFEHVIDHIIERGDPRIGRQSLRAATDSRQRVAFIPHPERLAERDGPSLDRSHPPVTASRTFGFAYRDAPGTEARRPYDLLRNGTGYEVVIVTQHADQRMYTQHRYTQRVNATVQMSERVFVADLHSPEDFFLRYEEFDVRDADTVGWPVPGRHVETESDFEGLAVGEEHMDRLGFLLDSATVLPPEEPDPSV